MTTGWVQPARFVVGPPPGGWRGWCGGKWSPKETRRRWSRGRTDLAHDHPSDIAIRLLVRGSTGQYERFEALPGDTIRTFDLVGLLAPLNVAEGHVVVVACNLQGEPIAHNQLSGSVRFRSMNDTAELPVAVFRAIPGTTGQALPSPEQLSLDGVEYAVPGNRQVLDFFAVGATPILGRPVRTQLGVVPLISISPGETPNAQAPNFDLKSLTRTK